MGGFLLHLLLFATELSSPQPSLTPTPIAWGPVSQGLQCGIQLDPTKNDLVLSIKNLRSEGISVSVTQFGKAMADLMVTDPNGKRERALAAFSTTNAYRFLAIPTNGSIGWHYMGVAVNPDFKGQYSFDFDGSFAIGGHFVPAPGRIDEFTDASAPIPLTCGPFIYIER